MQPRRTYADDPALNEEQKQKADKISICKREYRFLYTKQSILGEGTYGVVYKAVNNETGQTVAVKRLHLGNVRDGVPTTTLRELTALSHLNGHENVVSLKSFHIDIASCLSKPKLLLELEYCHYDLRMLCKRFPQRRLPLRLVEKIVKEITIGTAYCHSNRIIHRDLKPSNVLIKFSRPMEDVIKDIHAGRWDESWFTVKLADFGLARTHYSFRANLTHEVITLWYRAPEILLGNDAYGTGVDTWSIGCIVAELLYGRPLFTGDTEIHTLFKIFQFIGTPNEQTWPGIVECPDYKKVWPVWRPLADRWKRLRADVASGPESARWNQLIDFTEKALQIDPEARSHVHELAMHPIVLG